MRLIEYDRCEGLRSKGCDFEFVLANWADCTLRHTQISMHNAELRAKTVGIRSVLEPDFSAHAVMCKHSAQWRGQAWVCVLVSRRQHSGAGGTARRSMLVQRSLAAEAGQDGVGAAAVRCCSAAPHAPDSPHPLLPRWARRTCVLPASRGRRRSQCGQWRRMPRRKCARWRAQSHLCPPAAGYIRRFEHICV